MVFVNTDVYNSHIFTVPVFYSAVYSSSYVFKYLKKCIFSYLTKTYTYYTIHMRHYNVSPLQMYQCLQTRNMTNTTLLWKFGCSKERTIFVYTHAYTHIRSQFPAAEVVGEIKQYARKKFKDAVIVCTWYSCWG